MLSVYAFGDSMLDCGHYNVFGVNPGQLLVHNDDHLFPEFHGHDLASLGSARLIHRAQDGATVSRPDMGRGAEMQHFAKALESFLQSLPIRPVFLGNVYDPTFGDDALNFLGIEPSIVRQSHRLMNDVLAELARRYGDLVDLHTHFLSGDPSWYTQIIEPSLRRASEIRRCFLRQVLPRVRR